MSRLARLLPLLAALLPAACASAPRPAVLEASDTESLDALKAALAGAVGRARIELGPNDPSESPTVSVLPPPLGPNETSSPAMPVLFDLRLVNGACEAVRRDTGETVALADVECRPWKG